MRPVASCHLIITPLCWINSQHTHTHIITTKQTLHACTYSKAGACGYKYISSHVKTCAWQITLPECWFVFQTGVSLPASFGFNRSFLVLQSWNSFNMGWWQLLWNRFDQIKMCQQFSSWLITFLESPVLHNPDMITVECRVACIDQENRFTFKNWV